MTTALPVLRWILAVLASAWFFPVSCTTTAAVGTQLLAKRDARDVDRGDTVHPSIAVMTVPAAQPDRLFGYLLLGNLAAYRERHPEASFLMPVPEGSIELEDHTVVRFEVLQATMEVQVIETHYSDGDRRARGTYRATRREVTPLTSEVFDQRYFFGALPYALALALAILLAARLARRRFFPPPRGR